MPQTLQQVRHSDNCGFTGYFIAAASATKLSVEIFRHDI